MSLSHLSSWFWTHSCQHYAGQAPHWISVPSRSSAEVKLNSASSQSLSVKCTVKRCELVWFNKNILSLNLSLSKYPGKKKCYCKTYWISMVPQKYPVIKHVSVKISRSVYLYAYVSGTYVLCNTYYIHSIVTIFVRPVQPCPEL